MTPTTKQECLMKTMLLRIKISVMILTLILGMIGCADPVKDINRVQPNLIAKSDLEGEWYMLQTVVDIPSTTYFTFVGETSALERVRWELQEDLLVAYRSYERLRGSSATSTQVPFDGQEAPVAAYRVINHVDIRREYNSSTGEQSNVISENTFDRPWFEREYVRVDWSSSVVPNFEMIAPISLMTPVYFEQEELGDVDSLYTEDDENGVMRYFDVTSKYFVEPDEYGCIYALYYLGVGDCASAEIKVRASFSRVPQTSTYEPFQYDDPLMSRFGYFRTEYYEYDEQRGVVDAGRRNLINRHDIWQRSYDEEGRLIPVEDRVAKTVPYYLNEGFPEDLEEAAKATMRQWNEAAVKGLAALSDQALSEVEELDGVAQVFTLCHNPVIEGDPSACGEVGTARRLGDLRYSTLHWVDIETMEGLLGYGPSAADPISGEIISGRAYVYGAAVNTYASYALDVIRYFSEQVSLSDLANGDNFTEQVLERLSARPLDHGRLRHPVASTQTVTLKQARSQARPRMDARPRRRDLRPHDGEAIQSRIEQAPQRPSALAAEMKRALEARALMSYDELPDQLKNFAKNLSPEILKRIQAHRKAAIARSADLVDMIAPDVEGIVRRYAEQYEPGQDDALWRILREEVFAAVAEHEVGHTLGLRHNFQGSYDSINYPDAFWDLKAENLKPVEDIQGLFDLNRLTEKQSTNAMRQLQYSSIMDYGFSWQSDLNGVGRYDVAALIFGYTSHLKPVKDCDIPAGDEKGSLADPCVEPVRGFVEVFKKNRGELGCAGHLLDPPTPEEQANGAPNFECTLPGVNAPKREYVRDRLDASGPSVAFNGFSYDDPGLPSVTLLERYHYTSFAQALPSLNELSDKGRKLMLYEDFLAQREQSNFDERILRVPYLFCSDEWESALLSCHAFDHGADPYELMQNKQYSYQAYYPFVNFRRDRPEFEVWMPLFTYFFRDFLPLSDIFQSWYVAPYGYDDLFDTSYEAAIIGGLNLLMNVMTTPPHGTFCENEKEQLVYLGDSPNLQSEDRADPNCVSGGRFIYLPPGEGRRHFSTYDPEAGYQFELKPEEAGHYWATLAAAWALFDTEAYLIGLDGDAGVYSIGFFDWFEDEFYSVFGDMLTDGFERFAPRALPVEEAQQGNTPRLARSRYLSSGSFYGFDPLTGQVAEDPAAPPSAGPVGLCEACEANNDCAGYTGFIGGTFCGSLDDETYVCLQDCTEDDAACPAGMVCDESKNCVPSSSNQSCAPFIGDCSPDYPLGSCDEGSTCRDGECFEPAEALIIESDPTFMLKTDIFWYGFIYTTSSFSTRFNDQFNVFRPGTPSQVIQSGEADVQTFTFTDPESGISYAATQPRCELGASGGYIGLCGTCEYSEDCKGYIDGYYGEVFCVDLDGGGEGTCVQDCTYDESLCGAGFTCDTDTGNCVSSFGACAEQVCSPTSPNGACEEGYTCYEGTCTELDVLSPQCDISGGLDTVGVKMVKHGQALAAEYLDASNALLNFEGNDAAYNTAISRFYRSRYYMRSHIELLETLRATYSIFGQIY